MANAWRHVELSGLPPCDGETVFVGINTAGFACCFNDVTRDGVCSMVGPELTTTQMSCLRWWRVLDRPAICGVSIPVAAIEADDARRLADALEKLRCDHWTHWTAQENHTAAVAVRHLRLLAEHNALGVPGTFNDQGENRG